MVPAKIDGFQSGLISGQPSKTVDVARFSND
jgi:hypothetical protein